MSVVVSTICGSLLFNLMAVLAERRRGQTGKEQARVWKIEG